MLNHIVYCTNKERVLAVKLVLRGLFVYHRHFLVDSFDLIPHEILETSILINMEQRDLTYLLVWLIFLCQQKSQKSQQLASFEKIETCHFPKICERAYDSLKLWGKRKVIKENVAALEVDEAVDHYNKLRYFMSDCFHLVNSYVFTLWKYRIIAVAVLIPATNLTFDEVPCLFNVMLLSFQNEAL